MSTHIAQITGEWILGWNMEDELPPYYTVQTPSVTGQYLVQHQFGGPNANRRPLIKFNTNIGHTEIIDSVTLSRRRINNTDPMAFYYYLGTWTGSVPTPSQTAYEGGTLAGYESSNSSQTATISLSKDLINKSGVTDLKIRTDEEGFGYSYDYLTDLVLTIQYHSSTTEKTPKNIMQAI